MTSPFKPTDFSPQFKFGFSHSSHDLTDKVERNNEVIEFSLKKFATGYYFPEELKVLAEQKYKYIFLDKKKQQKENNPYRFNILIGTSSALSDKKFQKKFNIHYAPKKKESFLNFLSNFYKKRFQYEDTDLVEESLDKDEVIHIVLKGTVESPHRNQKYVYHDHIIGAISFVPDPRSCLVLWLGVENDKCFNDTFGNIKDYLNLPFAGNFKIGTFLLTCAQSYTNVRHSTWNICAQIHKGIFDGPKQFYLLNFFSQTDHTNEIIDHIIQNRREYLLIENNLIWMLCHDCIATLSLTFLNFTKNNEKKY